MSDGTTTDSLAISVLVIERGTPTATPAPAPLSASFDSVQSATSLDVTFTDTSSGSPTAWVWDFGDGSPPDLTANPVHRFATAGTYSVRLDVSDGTTTDSLAISVLVIERGTPPTPTATPPIPPPDSLTCSATIHTKYGVVGPDGKSYAAWHPQRDPSGCYFHHDHGSDPRLFAAASEYQPSFGYVTAQAGTSEPHAGFKNFLYETNGYHWLFTVHIGTAGPARVCTRYHSIDLAIARISDGQLMAVVHFMADFGRAEHNLSLAPLTPDACPNQYFAAVADDSYGVRQLSVNDRDNTQYEPWKPDLRRVILGLTAPGLEFNTVSAMTTCDGLTCNTVSATGHPGAGVWRMLDHDAGMVFKAGTQTGVFTTDAYGASVGGSVHQFVRSGANVAAGPNSGAEHAWPSDPYAMIFRCVIGNGPTTASSTNVDGQIRMPN